MLAILAPILVFGLVIFVHELGHFVAAKLMGVYAPRFSIGFGPALWKRRRGETEYILAAFPLGGYVRMASRLDAETAFLEGGNEEGSARDAGEDPEAMIPFGPKPVPENRWFESKPLLARIFIMVAGVTMNMALALVVCIGLAFSIGRTIVPTTVVGFVDPAVTQLAQGDTILAVNSVAVRSWNEVRREILRSQGAVALRTQRGDVRIPLGDSLPATRVAEAIQYHVPPVIETVVPGERAEAAGFRSGDSVVAVGGVPVRTWSDLLNTIGASADRTIQVEVARSSGRQTLTVTPKPTRTADPATGRDTTLGRIGAGVRDISLRQPIGAGEAVSNGARFTWGMTTAVVGFLGDLFVGKVSIDQLGGPVAITRASVTAARSGLQDLFYLIALLSVNVAVLNMLPIPILDGGQILINVVESARGAPFSLRTREYILRFGLLAIGLLFVIVMFNDTKGLFGWIAGLFG